MTKESGLDGGALRGEGERHAVAPVKMSALGAVVHALPVANALWRPRRMKHGQAEYLEFLELLGVDPQPLEWGLAIGAEERARQEAFFEELGRPACAVVIGTSRAHKDWPAERYARLLEALESDFG